MAVRFIRHKAIDRRRWDEAVARDPSCLPYGLSWWLDAATAARWDGLVLEDYRAVMPIPRGPWWARPRVQRPFFTQQCGPFGKVEAGDLSRFFAALPAAAGRCALPLTATAAAGEIPPPYTVSSRMNLVLDLNRPYEDIHAGYHKDLRRKLRKYPVAAPQPTSPEEVLTLYRTTSGARAGLSNKHYTRARALMAAALERDAGVCRRLNAADGELLAAVFLVRYRGRLINLLPASTAAGFRKDGMARLLDGVIRAHAGVDTLFDFEGSDVAGIARFFGQFGPVPRPYLSIQ